MIEQAWAAGFFDGEGTTHCYVSTGHYKYVILCVEVAQAAGNVGILSRFQSAVFGCGKIRGPVQDKKHPNWSPVYRWAAGAFEESQAVLAILWPYLDLVKRRQAGDAIRKYHSNLGVTDMYLARKRKVSAPATPAG